MAKQTRKEKKALKLAERLEILRETRDTALSWMLAVAKQGGEGKGSHPACHMYERAALEVERLEGTGTGTASGSVNMYFDGVALDRLDFGPGKKA